MPNMASALGEAAGASAGGALSSTSLMSDTRHQESYKSLDYNTSATIIASQPSPADLWQPESKQPSEKFLALDSKKIVGQAAPLFSKLLASSPKIDKENLHSNNIKENNNNKELDKRQEKRSPEVDAHWAWFILFCVFLLNTTTLGALKVHGLIYERIVRLNYYSRQDASWPVASASTIQNLAGPLTPILTKFVSWRLVELLQTILFVAANVGAFFSRSLYQDIICLGIMQGVGLSLRYNMNIVINNEYFQEYRTTAMGVSMAGATCGVFFLSPLVGLALDSDPYHFRQAYMVLALIMAANFILNLFIRPPAATNSQPETTSSPNATATTTTTTTIIDPMGSDTLVRRALTCSSNNDTKLLFRSPGSLKKGGEEDFGVAEANIENESAFRKNLPPLHYQQSTSSNIGDDGMMMIEELPLSSGDQRENNNDSPTADGRQNEDNDRWREAAIKLWRSPFFHCIWLMQTIYFYISRTYTIILVDLATDRGFAIDEARSTINYWVYGELMGRLILGPMVDARWLSIKHFTILTCLMTAISSYLLISDWLHGYYWPYCLLVMLVASFSSLIAMLIVPFGQTYLPNRSLVPWAYAMGAFVSSLFLLVRPMLIGLSRDTYHSYNLLIIIMASAPLIFAILFALLEPICLQFEAANNHQQPSNSSPSSHVLVP